MLRVLAADLGAGSVRVVAVDLDERPPVVTELHRVVHGPVRFADGSLRWDWDRLLDAVVHGLELGIESGPVASIAIDTWGVDYGLLNDEGRLLSPPYSYRDSRTAAWRAVADRIGAAQLYATTGIQLIAVNTLFQLAAHDRRELDAASALLMLPELIVHQLTGSTTGERTSAGTTALIDLSTGDWSHPLLDAIDVDPALMPRVARATTPAGSWRGVPVHLVGGHDTASAVAALPGPPPAGTAFVSSGTWMLVGAERPASDTSEVARDANFSNEPGVLGGVRFLKNVMGLWLLDQCRSRWGEPSVADLVAAAASVPAGGPTVDARDERFLAPADMEAEIRAAARLPATAGRDRVVRCILDSLACSTADVVAELGRFLGEPVRQISVVGGGSQNALLNRLTEEACGVPVIAGPVEATALGNALVQGIALGRFRDLAEARAALVP